MFYKGDWVVIKGLDMIPVQLEKDPYETEFTTEGRPVKRVRVVVADVPNPDGPYTNVELLRKASSHDFLNLYLTERAAIEVIKTRIAKIQDAHNKFLKSTSNSHILD